LDVLGTETTLSVESGKVHAVAWAGFNEGGDCSIVPQLVSHPEEAAGQAGARLVSFGWSWPARRPRRVGDLPGPG